MVQFCCLGKKIRKFWNARVHIEIFEVTDPSSMLTILVVKIDVKCRVFFPLRPSKQLASRNFLTSPPKKGYFTCYPGVTIGNHIPGIYGEYQYIPDSSLGEKGPRLSAFAGTEVRRRTREELENRDIFLVSSPGKKPMGPGSHYGLFSVAPHIDGKILYRKMAGPSPVLPTFEASGQRMLAQNLYPLQVYPFATPSELQ